MSSTSFDHKKFLPKEIHKGPYLINPHAYIYVQVKFNIKEAMENHQEGSEIDARLEEGEVLSSKQRRLLIKICVSVLVEERGL